MAYGTTNKARGAGAAALVLLGLFFSAVVVSAVSAPSPKRTQASSFHTWSESFRPAYRRVVAAQYRLNHAVIAKAPDEELRKQCAILSAAAGDLAGVPAEDGATVRLLSAFSSTIRSFASACIEDGRGAWTEKKAVYDMARATQKQLAQRIHTLAK